MQTVAAKAPAVHHSHALCAFWARQYELDGEKGDRPHEIRHGADDGIVNLLIELERVRRLGGNHYWSCEYHGGRTI